MRELTKDDVGSHVIFVDPTGAQHDALLTAVHGTKCCNLVYVLKDERQYDSYGRKTNKQYTSVMHGNDQQAHGLYWLWPGEDREAKYQPEKPNPLTAE